MMLQAFSIRVGPLGDRTGRARDRVPGIPDRPFVGAFAKQNLIVVVRENGRLLCRLRRRIYWLSQVAVALFGAGCTALLQHVLRHPMHRMPWPFTVLTGMLAVACWAVFVRNLFGTPWMEVDYGTRQIRLYRRRTGRPWRTFTPDEIAHFVMETQCYWDDEDQVENHVLSLIERTGRRLPLCASPDEALMRALANDLVRITGRNLETQ